MRTWDEIDDRLSYFLDDTTTDETDRTWRERLRINSWNWAQDMFCAHTPLSKVVTLEVLADTRTGRLPDDFYAMDMLHDTTEDRWLSTARRRQGDIRYTDDDVLEYWLWGGELKLEKAYTEAGTDLQLYYWAFYPALEFVVDATTGAVTVEQNQIHTPRWAELALLHLTAANILAPGEMQASYLGEWDTRQDSGNPIQNPRLKSIEFHVRMYDDILGRFPKANVGRSG